MSNFFLSILYPLLHTVEQVEFATIYQCDNQLAKQGVGPRKPRAGEFVGIILMERLVHEAFAGICVKQHLETLLDFFIIVACERPHYYAHRPNIIIAYMGATYSTTGSATEKVRVVFAQHKTASVLVNRVVDIHLAQIWQ